jgi:hypothetical protein
MVIPENGNHLILKEQSAPGVNKLIVTGCDTIIIYNVYYHLLISPWVTSSILWPLRRAITTKGEVWATSTSSFEARAREELSNGESRSWADDEQRCKGKLG